jgi:peptidoglycan/xylan/chitin deacetylase (PgdA/CDA1 family)
MADGLRRGIRRASLSRTEGKDAGSMIDMRINWPNGARVAVMLTFDFDAETLWLSRDPANAKRPGTLSQGTYGAKVAVPKILEVLKEAGVKGTFFVPGWTAEHHTGRVEMILREGHEIAHHSYSHRWIDPDFPDQEIEEMEKGLDALKRTVGVVPKGYRSPAGETSELLIRLLQKHSFLYDSSLMDDINPYRHILPDGTKGPIELPWHWSLDDAPFALFSIKSPRPIFTNSHIKEVWQDEFREIYRWGGLFDLLMHPQVSGRPSRIALLREMIAWIQTFPGVWFATGTEVAEAWARAHDKG